MTARLFVPGRIEVLGKHTDYAGGRSLLAATDRGFTVEVEPVDGDAITLRDVARGETVVVPVPREGGGEGAEGPPGTGPPAAPDWAVYPGTVAERVARDFPGALRGCRIDFESDLPPAAGLSSSSALVTAVFLALDAACGISERRRYRSAIPDREALAGYLGAVERGSPFPGLGMAGAEEGRRRELSDDGSDGAGSGEGAPDGGASGGGRAAAAGVGTRGGSEDHVAMLCAEAGALVRYAFEPVRREGRLPAPAGHLFVVAASGVAARKAGDARGRYNRLSDEAARAAELWRAATGGEHRHLGGIVGDAGASRLLEVVARAADPGEREALLRRVRHFVAESEEIVPAAAAALAAGEAGRFGVLVDRSQAAAEELLRNQVPETVHLARTARELGAVAASAFGAGFGGSVWALAPEPEAAGFAARWRERYLAAFPHRSDAAVFFATPAGPPARSLA